MAKKQPDQFRWRPEGHRRHKNSDPAKNFREAEAYSLEHPRTPVILEQFLTRKQEWWVTLALKNGKWDPGLTVSFRKKKEAIFEEEEDDAKEVAQKK